MRRRIATAAATVLFTLTAAGGPAQAVTGPSRGETLEALRRAAAFVADSLAYRGGYVQTWSEDLTRRWGEIPARPTQILVQPPGTTTVGMTFLEAYRVTGDTAFLAHAERAASALVYGQHPAGGWHYIIDFDMPGIRRWYDEVASRCWGWEEYLHYYGNCTFDDEATTAPADFLLELYTVTGDPAWREALDRALAFILQAQFPNGAWPQRYPLMNDHPQDGRPDYTSFYTFNDNVISNNIHFLLKAWRLLGDERYREAAVRGMDFYIISRMPPPQAGWAQQYSHDMRPGWGRSYEPDALCVVDTVNNIRDLMEFYRITGDRRYLAPIPDAIAWLKASDLTGSLPGDASHAYFYETGTNRPLWSHRSGTSIDDGRYWVDYDITDYYPYGVPLRLAPTVEALAAEYERAAALTPDGTREERNRESPEPSRPGRPGPARVREVIDGLDNRGAWVTDVSIPHYFTDALKEPRDVIRGIDVRTTTGNMRVLIDHLREK